MNSLFQRMKIYEDAAETTLPRRLPVIIRVDGKAFHTYTKCLAKERGKPFNRHLIHVMETTAMKLCREVQGTQLAYTQSDEISLLVHGYKTFSTQPWLNNRIQKMCSIAAGVASATFTKESWKIWKDPMDGFVQDDIVPAVFDARVFVLPEAEVCNYFIQRQQDATRNSIQSLARSLYSHRQCDHKNTDQLKEMCTQAEVPWESLPTTQQRGRCLVRLEHCWTVDYETPMFVENRDYINKHLELEEE